MERSRESSSIVMVTVKASRAMHRRKIRPMQAIFCSDLARAPSFSQRRRRKPAGSCAA
jgi:hypothetical protein